MPAAKKPAFRRCPFVVRFVSKKQKKQKTETNAHGLLVGWLGARVCLILVSLLIM